MQGIFKEQDKIIQYSQASLKGVDDGAYNYSLKDYNGNAMHSHMLVLLQKVTNAVTKFRHL
ncbi:hypothetical protein [Paenibacillus sp. 203]|uniref:hypothetical protein n=1 Tax=Paenibacillus sp. 203 TaxID=3096765 RepID=UPI0029DD994A|nr:hypothetical protein [Paenibacillus sp. UKAQ_18]